MAQIGRGHWPRAVVWTFAGIFVISLLAGVLVMVTRGALAVPAKPGQPSPAPATRSDDSADGAGKAGAKAAPVSAQVAAVGEDALLRLSDLPAGWASGASPAAPARVSPWSAPIVRCIGVNAHAATIAPTKVESPDYTSADKQLAVEDSVSVYPSAKAAQAEYTAMAGNRATSCMNAVAGPTLEASMQHAAATGTTIGRVTFSALPSGAAAQHEAGFTLSIPVASSGRVLAITSTQVDFVHGSLLHQVTFNGNGVAFPPTLEIALLAAVQNRS